MTEKNAFREKLLSQSKPESSSLCSSFSLLSGKSSISSFSSEFSQLSHEHISVQTKLFLKHRHQPSTQPPLQPQELSSITDLGAGRFVVITGSYKEFALLHVHPKRFGSGRDGFDMCDDFHCKAV